MLYHIRLRAELRRVTDGADVFEVPPWTAGGTVVVTEEVMALMQMPREAAATVLLEKVFADTLAKVAQQI